MFDLNELPDNEGPAGRSTTLLHCSGGGRGGRVTAAKAEDCDDDDIVFEGEVEDEVEDEEEGEDEDDEEVEGEQQVFYTSENSTKIICRLIRDEEAVAKDPPQSFLRLDSTSSMSYSNDWQPLGIASFVESEIDTDNEVTVAALDARAILDSQCVSGLDSAVSLVVPTEAATSFGISPRPEKLGQRTETSCKQRPDFTNFHRSAGKWDGFLVEKRGSERLEDELSLDCRQSPLYPQFVSARKGKRAREEENRAALDSVIKLKRHTRPTSTLTASDAFRGAGPSLSMALDEDAPERKIVSFSNAYKMTTQGDGSEHEAAPSLSLGESSLSRFESTTAVQRSAAIPAPGSKSNLGLSTTVNQMPIGKTVGRAGDNLDAVINVIEDDDEAGPSTKGLDRKIPPTAGQEQPVGAVGSEKPFWQGKVCAQGFSDIDAAAYCSESLHPASKLWSLPPVMTVETLVKIEEFLAAVKKVNVVEPFIRLRLLPGAVNNEQSFSSMVTVLNTKKKGKAKGRSYRPEMQLGWQNALHAWRNGPLASAGAEYIFVANLKLKHPTEASRRPAAKLYLVLRSTCEAVSNMDREIGGKLLEELDWPSRPDEDLLVGFLCVTEEAGRSVPYRCAADAKAEVSLAGIEVSPTKGTAPVVLPTVLSNKVEVIVDSAVINNRLEKIDALHTKLQSDDGDIVASTENEERTVLDGLHDTKSKDQKEHTVDSSHEGRRLDKGRGRKESHSLRHRESPVEDDGHKDRDRQRDRDRDLRGREKDKDLRNKDVHRYSHRSNEKSDLSKRGRSKDRESDRFRERTHRDSHRDLSERPKSSRERMKEQEKEKHKERQRDREKEKDRERPGRKRDRSAEPEKGTIDDIKLALESEKAVSSVKEESHDHALQQSGKENRKRIRADTENTPAHDTVVSEVLEVRPQKEVTKPAKGVGIVADSLRNVPLPGKKPAQKAVQSFANLEGTDSVMEPLFQAEPDVLEGKSVNAEGAVQVDVEHNDRDDQIEEIPAGHNEQIATPPSATHTTSFNGTGRALPSNADVKVVVHDNSLVAKACDTAPVSHMEAKPFKDTEEGRVQDGEESQVVHEGALENIRPHPQACVQDGLSDDITDGDQVENGRKNLSNGIVEFHSNVGEQCKAEDKGVSEPSYDPTEERISDTEMLDDVQPMKSTSSLSGQVDNVYYAGEGQKSDNNDGSQELEALPRKFLEGSNALPSTDKTAISGADDSQGNLMGVESPSMDNGLVGSSLSLSAEVSCEIILEGCDKETRVWLVSKQNACYLSEEFGVRIVRLEEVVNSKLDVRLKTQRGPLNVRVFLATEKSTDSNEAKWFVNQAADVLRALASRGVFAKCLWYGGQVQRYAGDQAPSIQVIVKRIKGEDGKNLERIQEETGVMIGIVLDANTKKGIVNSARVIGLRLKGTRKKGFQEATKQVQQLLSHVAEQFSRCPRAILTGSQDVALLKLKVDFPNSTSPSSGILTPMQKDVFAAYSPVSPVATLSPLGSFKCKLDEPSIEPTYTASATAPTTLPPDSTLTINPASGGVGDFVSQSQQSEDEQPDNGLSIPDPEVTCPRPLFVSNLPERASASMLRKLFEDVLKEKYGSFGGSDIILDVKLAPDKYCAFVEFASEDLLLEVLKMYADNRPAFFGLNLELGSSGSLNKFERLFLAARTETASKSFDYGGGIVDSPTFARPRSGRKGHRSDDHLVRAATLRSSTDSDIEVINQDERFGGRDGSFRYLRVDEKPKPLFLTELMRNASARSIHTLFEDIIKKYINPSLGNFKGRATVLDVRYIPSRGCAFVDLATPELVEFMLDLHSRRPEVFFHMKMEIGRRPVPLGQGEEEPVVKRSSHLGRNALVEESHSYGSGRRARGYYPSTSPPARGNELAVMDHDFMDDYEDEDEERQPSTSRKRRSDPERTVYADRLPENASEGMIRRIFERVLRENMTEEQRDVLGEHIITEVRYVPTKFCAFVVFVAEELTRLVLQLYNQDEEIFKNMRLKPHFHSRMEDLYREDLHDREDGPPHRVLSSRDMSNDRRSRRGMDDYQNGYSTADIGDIGHRGRHSSAHRAVASTAFKEVDRRRSVYVDRIPERLPEATMRELFERALRQHRHGYNSRVVSQVTFFRDKFDPEKLCAFVELDNEDLVQELLDAYMEDEESFSGMRVRPAVKYGN